MGKILSKGLFIEIARRLSMRHWLMAASFSLLLPAAGIRAQDSTTTLRDTSMASADTTKHPEGVLHKTDSLLDVRNKRPHVYRINYWITGGYCLLATAGNLYAIPNILHNKLPITDAELQGLNPDALNRFDHLSLEQDPGNHDKYQKLGDILLPSFIVSAGILGFDKRVRQDWLRILLMYYETHAVVFTLYNFSPFGPAYQNKYRPITYYSSIPYGQRISEGNRNSLFSGHTANTAAATFFMAKVYSDYHPELGNKKYWLYAGACVPPLVEAYIRFKALMHFPSDLMEGFVIGAVVGVVMPSLHKVRTQNVEVGVTSVPNGAGLGLIWKPTKKERKLLQTFKADKMAMSR